MFDDTGRQITYRLYGFMRGNTVPLLVRENLPINYDWIFHAYRTVRSIGRRICLILKGERAINMYIFTERILSIKIATWVIYGQTDNSQTRGLSTKEGRLVSVKSV